MIAIPNMDKTKSCWECFNWDCEHWGEHGYDKPTDCPLIEIDIVRCGECKHYVREVCQLDPFWERYTEPNDFCSQGERRAE